MSSAHMSSYVAEQSADDWRRARDREMALPSPIGPDWKVLKIALAVPGEVRGYYKLRVQGHNRNYRPEAPNYTFSWVLPDVADVRFDLSEATIDAEALPYLAHPTWRTGGAAT